MKHPVPRSDRCRAPRAWPAVFAGALLSACVANIGRHTAKLTDGGHFGVDAGALIALPASDRLRATTDSEGDPAFVDSDETKSFAYTDAHFQYDQSFGPGWAFSARVNSGFSWLLGRYGSAIPTLDWMLQFPRLGSFYYGVGADTVTHWGPYLIATHYFTPRFFVTALGGYEASPEFDTFLISSRGDALNGSLIRSKLSLGWEFPGGNQLILWAAYYHYLSGKGPNVNPNDCFNFGWDGPDCDHVDDRREHLLLTGLGWQF